MLSDSSGSTITLKFIRGLLKTFEVTGQQSREGDLNNGLCQKEGPKLAKV